MAEPITTAQKSEVIPTGHKRVACHGPDFGRHPNVYLTMVDDEQGNPENVVCPYCSRVYQYNPRLAKPSGGH